VIGERALYDVPFSHQEATAIVVGKTWPPLIDTDDMSKRRLSCVYRAPTPEMLCYLDFSVSTTGMLAGIKVRDSNIQHIRAGIKVRDSNIQHILTGMKIH
jgi:hypothetical protein